MKIQENWRLTGVLFALFFLTSTKGWSSNIDEDMVENTLKVNKCLKCHSVDRKKEGPAYKDVAKKYKNKPDAEKKLFKHLTTSPMVEIDGVEEEHKVIKTKNEAETYNLIRWVLSQ